MFLGSGQHLDVLDRIDLHCRDEVRRQLGLMLDDVFRSTPDRRFVGLVNINSGFRRERMNICPGTERVLSHVRPREVRLDAGRRFGDKRYRPRRSNGRNFIVTRGQRDVAWNAKLAVDERRIGFAIGFKLGKTPFSLPSRSDASQDSRRTKPITFSINASDSSLP